jgi:hypothetical protein
MSVGRPGDTTTGRGVYFPVPGSVEQTVEHLERYHRPTVLPCLFGRWLRCTTRLYPGTTGCAPARFTPSSESITALANRTTAGSALRSTHAASATTAPHSVSEPVASHLLSWSRHVSLPRQVSKASHLSQVAPIRWPPWPPGPLQAPVRLPGRGPMVFLALFQYDPASAPANSLVRTTVLRPNPARSAPVKSVSSVTNVTNTLAVLAALAAFKPRCGFLEGGQPVTWPSSTPPRTCHDTTPPAGLPIPAPAASSQVQHLSRSSTVSPLSPMRWPSWLPWLSWLRYSPNAHPALGYLALLGYLAWRLGILAP